ncbi:hypothetical protein D3C87_1533730 [compost metagenome]
MHNCRKVLAGFDPLERPEFQRHEGGLAGMIAPGSSKPSVDLTVAPEGLQSPRELDLDRQGGDSFVSTVRPLPEPAPDIDGVVADRPDEP